MGNEINKQKRLRDAAIMAAEGEKVKVVKAAEAQADAAQLQGEGIARQRRAIIDGLRDSITHGTNEQLSTDKVSELLLVTQYFETLRDIAATSKAQTVFTKPFPRLCPETTSASTSRTCPSRTSSVAMWPLTPRTSLPLAPRTSPLRLLY